MLRKCECFFALVVAAVCTSLCSGADVRSAVGRNPTVALILREPTSPAAAPAAPAEKGQPKPPSPAPPPAGGQDAGGAGAAAAGPAAAAVVAAPPPVKEEMNARDVGRLGDKQADKMEKDAEKIEDKTKGTIKNVGNESQAVVAKGIDKEIKKAEKMHIERYKEPIKQIKQDRKAHFAKNVADAYARSNATAKEISKTAAVEALTRSGAAELEGLDQAALDAENLETTSKNTELKMEHIGEVTKHASQYSVEMWTDAQQLANVGKTTAVKAYAEASKAKYHVIHAVQEVRDSEMGMQYVLTNAINTKRSSEKMHFLAHQTKGMVDELAKRVAGTKDGISDTNGDIIDTQNVSATSLRISREAHARAAEIMARVCKLVGCAPSGAPGPAPGPGPAPAPAPAPGSPGSPAGAIPLSAAPGAVPPPPVAAGALPPASAALLQHARGHPGGMAGKAPEALAKHSRKLGAKSGMGL